MGKLEHIETFVKVVEANSLALAAKRLGLSAAAISKQISALECELKVHLLARTTRRLELTELGHVYYQQCKGVMRKVDDLDEMIHSQQIEPSGELSVLSSRYFADHYVIPHLPEFFAKYPKITLDLTLIGRASDLSRDDIDLFFGITHAVPGEVVQQEIAQGAFSLCASPSYLQEYGVPQKPQDLAHHRFVTYSVRSSCQRLCFNNEQEIYLYPLLRVSDMQMMISCALEGLGFIKLHSLEAQSHLDAGTLVEILPGFQEAPQPIYLTYFRHRYLQPKVRHFIEFYLEKLNAGGAYVEKHKSESFC